MKTSHSRISNELCNYVWAVFAKFLFTMLSISLFASPLNFPSAKYGDFTALLKSNLSGCVERYLRNVFFMAAVLLWWPIDGLR